MKELDRIEPEAVLFEPLPVFAGFFDADPIDACTDADLADFKRRILQLEIQKKNVSESIRKTRERYPRHYEPWSEEECRILQELMQKTNDIEIFCACLQRTPNSIRIKVEGKNQM